jgi:N6-L-threonylcarbamoyladenine synthase
VLCAKAYDAASFFNCASVALAGGVACNGALRARFEQSAPAGIRAIVAPRKFCTDNAAMVAGLVYHHFVAGQRDGLELDAFARLPR